MSAPTTVPDEQSVSGQLRHVEVISTKFAIVLSAATAILLAIVGLVPREGDVRFRLSGGSEALQIPSLEVPAMPLAWASVVICLVLAVLSWVLWRSGRRTPWYVGVVFGVVFLAGFLGWAGAGSPSDVPVSNLLGSSILLAVPIIFGALGGTIGERAGVVNIAIEGQLLGSAFVAAIVGTMTQSPWAGLLAGMFAGALVALVLGVFTITYRVDQVIVGVVLNVLVLGLTSFIYSQVLVPQADLYNSTVRFPRVSIPVLSEIPIIGSALFHQSIIVYLLYLTVPAIWFAMFRTRWGLRLRAVGEHPLAADTVGIKVKSVRYRALLVAGAIVGMGGAYYTLVSVSGFGKNMTAGAGFIALAAVIFGKWDPIKATLAGLLFGFSTALASAMSIVQAPVPSQFMLMLPYVVTLLAVAGLIGRSRAPAASGTAYVKE
ncbi:ABC transporter permease [Sanguibacter sp. HDW7]|uniref:ABC transporter permease n=1 Tax=Sanguibacter sp. HDW7 TaxID=2714931 RepID=UPI001407E793|nr:ABC transporter permease [Sanguibacter sp. HDW7]QIK82926.1 ABC transporter permease [Sanguibacter sp. HDW7]